MFRLYLFYNVKTLIYTKLTESTEKKNKTKTIKAPDQLLCGKVHVMLRLKLLCGHIIF